MLPENKENKLPKNRLFLSAVIAGLLGLYSVPAQAGFDWTPGPQAAGETVQQGGAMVSPAPQQMQDGPLTPEPDALPVPVENVDSQSLPEPLSKVPPQQAAPQQAVMEERNTADAPIILMSPAEDEKGQKESKTADMLQEAETLTETVPVAPSTPAPAAVVAPAPEMPAMDMTSPASAAEPVLEGFGKEIPLALALRDIVPPQYAYSFVDTAYAGLIVSWKGGKPWLDVLNEALAQHRLAAAISGRAVVIGSPETATVSTEDQQPPIEQPANPVSLANPEIPAEAGPADMIAPPLVENENSEQVSQELPIAQLEEKPGEKDTGIPVMSEVDTGVWVARPGYTLRQVMKRWGKTANVEVEWNSPYDYPINNAFSFKGSYEDAVSSLLGQYSRETPRPRGRLYPNLPKGPSVLMIN